MATTIVAKGNCLESQDFLEKVELS